MKNIALIIADGIGYKEKTKYNAFFHAKKPNYDYLFENVPYGMISTYGESAGLPKGQMGNSEVGHMLLGSGRTIYQSLVRINRSIEKNELKNHHILKSIKSQRVHLSALISDGGVHSHINHVIALANILVDFKKEVFMHIITDGRDTLPKKAKGFIEHFISSVHSDVKIASISGRFFAMDRDKRWERTQKTYDCMVGASLTNKDIYSYIDEQYSKGINDEFIEPVSFERGEGDKLEGIKSGEAIIFANFRSDRMRQLAQSFGDCNFTHFKRDVQIKPICMCEYNEEFDYPVLFQKEIINNTLAQVLANNGLSQLHIAETEKYAHVTFFFNGGIEKPFENEKRVVIPSPKVKTYDLKPQMSAYEVCDETIKGIKEGYNFVVVNFANGDMVGHTGDLKASIKAVEAVDENIGRILNECKNNNYSAIITSDHGNCEEMMDEEGNILTNHTVGDVWCFVHDDNIKSVKNGSLSNIAPSVLKLMGIQVPKEMEKPLI